MYYFNVSVMTNEAVMPRILAEDTGATELRNPLFCAKTSFHFRRPSWKKVSPSPRTCCRPCTCPASC